MRSHGRFLISNFLLLLVPISMGVIFYVQTRNLLERRVYESNLRLLDQGRTLIDTELREFEEIIQQLSIHPQLRQLLSITDPLEIPDLEELIRFTREDYLFPYSISNSLIMDYFIFIEPGRIVVGPQQALLYETFFRFLLPFEGYTAQSWYDKFIRPYHTKCFLPAAKVRYATAVHHVIPYVHSFGTKEHHPLSIMILIDTRALFRLLKHVGVAPGGFVVVTDEDGQPIVTSLPEGAPMPDVAEPSSGAFSEITFRGRKMLVTRSVSPSTGWRYYSATPLVAVRSDLRYIKVTTLLVIAFLVLLGIIAAVCLAFRNSRPVIQLVKNNREMELALDRQLPYLRSGLIEKLLSGGIVRSEATELLFHSIDFPILEQPYVVAVIKLRFSLGKSVQEGGEDGIAHKSADVQRLMIKDVIAQTLPHPILIHDFDIDRLAVIIALPPENGQATAMFQEMKHALLSRFTYQISIGVGSVYDGINRIPRSFEEARIALDYRVADSTEPVYFFGDLPEHRNNYHYPGNAEVQVIALAKAGHRSDLVEALREIENTNFRARRLSTDSQRALLFDMHGTITRITEQSFLARKKNVEETSSELLRMLFTIEPEEGYRRIAALLEAICTDVEEQKRSHNARLCGELQAFLEDNYLDRNLCLKQISARFGLSEHYLSHFIKEQVGKNFFTYVEELRMQHALAQLRKTDLQIKDIAEASGYSSLNSFCRAFKRIYGISPREYRVSSRNEQTVT